MTPDYLKTALEQMDANAAEFARALHVSRTAVFKWLHGTAPIPHYAAFIIAEALRSKRLRNRLFGRTETEKQKCRKKPPPVTCKKKRKENERRMSILAAAAVSKRDKK